MLSPAFKMLRFGQDIQCAWLILTHVSEIVLPPCTHLSLSILESLKVTFILYIRNFEA